MNPITIFESGMEFGPFNPDDIYQIEKSPSFDALGSGLKRAEFLVIKDSSKLWIIEAKQSAPKPTKAIEFEAWIQDVAEKLRNSLSFYLAIHMQRQPPKARDELPKAHQALKIQSAPIKFILVMNGFDKGWLPPISDKLKLVLNSTIKTWGLGPNACVVMNHELAKAHSLIK